MFPRWPGCQRGPTFSSPSLSPGRIRSVVRTHVHVTVKQTIGSTAILRTTNDPTLYAPTCSNIQSITLLLAFAGKKAQISVNLKLFLGELETSASAAVCERPSLNLKKKKSNGNNRTLEKSCPAPLHSPPPTRPSQSSLRTTDMKENRETRGIPRALLFNHEL